MKTRQPQFSLQASKFTIAKARALRKRMTPEEKKIWSHLRKRSLGIHFRKQAPFGPYILDFFCVTQKLAIELDGAQHGKKEAKEYDDARDGYLRSHGIAVLRFSNRDVNTNLDSVLAAVWRSMEERDSNLRKSLGESTFSAESTANAMPSPSPPFRGRAKIPTSTRSQTRTGKVRPGVP